MSNILHILTAALIVPTALGEDPIDPYIYLQRNYSERTIVLNPKDARNNNMFKSSVAEILCSSTRHEMNEASI